jgi:hypothetical protein
MKRSLVRVGARVALAGFAALPLLVGCVERRVVYVHSPPPSAPAGEVVVNEAPPTPPSEVIVTAPGPDYVWVPGYYSWQGRWIWIGGSWIVPPHRHAVWVGGHWGYRGRGYVWVGGRWR